MVAYAVGLLSNLEPHPEVVEYLSKIDDTMTPFSGRWVVHGSEIDVVEGSFDGRFVLIEFPDLAQAKSWYNSQSYQDLIPLRTRHADYTVFFVEGLEGPHVGTDVAQEGTHF